ncbi:MAG: biopolymer transporter ExbD, partial [Gallionellaceae bacterium]|nr:biopolymer transporter ExbD [Gallionellaceae bacterium]
AVIPYTNATDFAAALKQVVGDQQDPVIIINTDAKAPYQAVVNVMEAARINGYSHITFTTDRK